MMYKLFCAIFGQQTDAFHVNIDKAQTVSDLKGEIKKEIQQTLGSIDHGALTLYKVDIDVSDNAAYHKAIEQIHHNTVTASKELLSNPVHELSAIFGQSIPAGGRIHILVQLPLAKRKREEVEPDTPSKRLRGEHSIARKTALEKAPPSQAAKASHLSIQQRNDPILNGRPHTARGPHVILFEQAFTEFHSSMRGSPTELILSPDYYRMVGDLLVVSSGIFNNERERQNALHQILGPLLGRALQVTVLEDGTSNGGVCVVDLKQDNQLALLLLCEKKNEIGQGECDPCVQASFSFSRWWSQEQASMCRDSSLCSSFILSIAGPWVSVHGAILLGKDWIVQPLSDLIWTGTTPDLTLDAHVRRVAQLFHNLKTGLDQLEEKYKNIQRKSADVYFPFPYITSYSIPDTDPPATVEFTYKKRLHYDDARQSTAVFLAEDTTGKQIFIKFTSRYNAEAHRLLAKEKYAPQLLHCSEAIPGCFIVVMEYIAGDNMHGCQFSSGDLDQVRRAKAILHEHDIVFGDLRPNNIMKPKDRPGVLLVDFDWCGTHGVSRYPVTVNKDCGWHMDVKMGAVMRKEHDDHLLASLETM